MRKLLIPAVALILSFSCTHKKTLPEQLAAAFSNRLTGLDPKATLDSVHILWSTPINERLGRIVDDSVYVREYNRITWQLAAARQNHLRDSAAFYRYEIHVMEREIDSISKVIPLGDTTHSAGVLIGCAYFLRKNGVVVADSTLLYLDTAQVLRYTWYMDESMARTLQQMK
jgi:hypothetical protein